MKRFIACFVLVTVFLSGCTGSFMLTKKVYDFHRSQEDKWMDELIFLGVVIFPVYGLATLGDAIIFNSIEFWTGENPVEAKAPGQIQKVVSDKDMEAILTYTELNDSVRIDSFKSNSPKDSLMLERTMSGVVAKDPSGSVVYTSLKDSSGGISVYDTNKKLVKYFSSSEINSKKQKLLNN